MGKFEENLLEIAETKWIGERSLENYNKFRENFKKFL